jgi:uncharacterized OB-fold protein
MHDHQHLLATSAPSEMTFSVWRCYECMTLFSPLPLTCRACGGTELSPVAASGFGTVVSWRAVEGEHRRSSDEDVPAFVAIVALDAGPWLYAWIVGEAPMRHSRVVVQRKERTQRLPVFALEVSEGMDRAGGDGNAVSAVRWAHAA